MWYQDNDDNYDDLDLIRDEHVQGFFDHGCLFLTPGVLILTHDEQQSQYPRTIEEFETGLRRGLLILLSLIPRFRAINPWSTGISLVMELLILQRYVFSVAQHSIWYTRLPNHSFIPIILKFDHHQLRTLSMNDMIRWIEGLQYPGNSVGQVLQTFLCLDKWNTREFITNANVLFEDTWAIDTRIPLSQMIGNGPVQSSIRQWVDHDSNGFTDDECSNESDNNTNEDDKSTTSVDDNSDTSNDDTSQMSVDEGHNDISVLGFNFFLQSGRFNTT